MSSTHVSENTGLLPGSSTPIPSEHDRFSILIGILANIAFLAGSFALPIFCCNTPGGGKPIFDISDENPTWFTIRHEFVVLYWFMLFFLQTRYLSGFFCSIGSTGVRCQRAARLGIFFILHNIFIIVWAFLWTHSLFKWSNLVLLLDFIQLCIGCGVDHESRFGRRSRRERENPADQENQGAQRINRQGWPVDTREFSFINRAAVLSLPLTFMVYMLPWGVAIDFTCQGRLCDIVTTATLLFPLIYGLVFMGCLRDCIVGLASTFLAVGLLVRQWDNSNEWHFRATVANAAVTGIFSIWATKDQYDRGF